MKKNLNMIVNGKSYQVEIDECGGEQTSVLVNGVEYSVRVGASEGAPLVVKPAAVPVPMTAPLPTNKLTPPPAALSNALSAPMPGTILDVAVKPGDKVVRGDLLCALEAMKMKNAIRAPREAVIASVEVHNGQKVLFGDVLIKFA